MDSIDTSRLQQGFRHDVFLDVFIEMCLIFLFKFWNSLHVMLLRLVPASNSSEVCSRQGRCDEDFGDRSWSRGADGAGVERCMIKPATESSGER